MALLVVSRFIEEHLVIAELMHEAKVCKKIYMVDVGSELFREKPRPYTNSAD